MATFYANYPGSGGSGGGSGSNASVGTTGTTAPTSATEVGFIDGSGNLQPFSGTSASTGPNVAVTSFPSDVLRATQNITVQDTASSATVQGNSQTWYSGTPTTGSAAVFVVNAQGTGQLEISGTWTGTLQSEVSIDGGVNWIAHSIHPIGTPIFVATYTANQAGSLSLGGKTHVRVRAIAAMTGTAVVELNVTTREVDIYVANPIKLIDGSSSSSTIQGTIKAASTAALATDTSLVVQQSPNGNQSTAALQTTGNSSLSSILANQTNGTQQTTIVGTVPLSTGAATAALQSNVQGTVAPGTAATSSELVGMVYNSTAQTPTNGQQLALQSDQYGNLATSNLDILITGAPSQTTLNNNILLATAGSASLSTAGFRSMSVQVNVTATSGAFIFEGSNDGTNFFNLVVYNGTFVNGVIQTVAVNAVVGNILFIFPVTTAFVRCRISTALGGGSISAFTRMSPIAWIPPVVQVSQNTAGNLNTTATVTSVASAQTAIPGTVTDVTAAAITTTTTSGPFTPAYGSSYMVNIAVTAVSGTTPTMVVQVQESADGGTNYYTVYTFSTITATGSYNSPVITLTGRQVRYVQTLAGTTPSFTRAIVRLQSSQSNYASPTGTTFTDRSGTTSGTASTSTQLAPVNQNRRYLLIQNLSSSTPIYINFTSAATAGSGSLYIAPLGSYVSENSTISTEAVNVLATVASIAFTAKEG